MTGILLEEIERVRLVTLELVVVLLIDARHSAKYVVLVRRCRFVEDVVDEEVSLVGQ